MAIKTLNFTLTILTIIHGCVGQSRISNIERAEWDQKILDVYHKTDPMGKDHENRMRNELPASLLSQGKKKGLMSLRRRALTVIAKKCKEWADITRWKQKTTDKQLAEIYLTTKTGEPDQEGRMRQKLMEVDPSFRKIDPEIIRSVVHDWYRRHLKVPVGEHMNWPREYLADLSYISQKVQSGGKADEREIIERFLKIHPDWNVCSDAQLLEKVRQLPQMNFKPTSNERRKARKRYETVFEPPFRMIVDGRTVRRDLAPEQKSALEQRILDAYHRTNPFKWGHEKRLNDELQKEIPEKEQLIPTNLKKYVRHLLDNMYEQWEQITGLNRRVTDDILSEIVSRVKINEPDREARMREELLEVHPEFHKVNSEIIRSVVHDWYIRHMREGFRSREQQADLLYAYQQVKSGKGAISDRLAKKWQRLHPELSNYSKHTLIIKAHELHHNRSTFSPEEMETAKERYERVFGVGSSEMHELEENETIEWTREQNADLLHLYHIYKKGRSLTKDFYHYWQLMHPELGRLLDTRLSKQLYALIERKFKLTPDEEAAANLRLKQAIARKKRKYGNTMLLKQGRSPASEYFHEQNPNQQSSDQMIHASSSHSDYNLPSTGWDDLHELMNIDASNHTASRNSLEQEVHQRSPDWINNNSPLHKRLQLNQEERNDLEMWMNSQTSHHSPILRYSPSSYHYDSNIHTAPIQVPSETSHSNFVSFTSNPYNANRYYESGSSSRLRDKSHL